MPVERRGWVTHGVCWVNGRPEELSCLAGRRQPSLSGTSRMRRESHVRICERLGVRFPGPTRQIEHIPLPDNSVDVIISNCVINLSADKDRVLREAFRVLKPRGRFAVSDVVTRGAVPEALRRDMLLWVGCIAGALDENDYRMKLAVAGFEAIG